VTPHKTHQISKHYSSQIHQVGDQRQNQIEGCKTKTDGTTTSMWGATILESSTKSCLQDRQKRCGPQRAQSSQRKGEGRAECHTHPGSSLFLRLPPWPLCLNRHLNSSSGLWRAKRLLSRVIRWSVGHWLRQCLRRSKSAIQTVHCPRGTRPGLPPTSIEFPKGSKQPVPFNHRQNAFFCRNTVDHELARLSWTECLGHRKQSSARHFHNRNH